MDPYATISDMLDAMEQGDYETAHEHMTNLRDWQRLGGFTPNVKVERVTYNV